MSYTRVRAHNLETRLIRAGFYCGGEDRESSISMGWNGFLDAEYGSIEEAITRIGSVTLLKVQSDSKAAGPVMVQNDRVNLPGSVHITMMGRIFKLASSLVETDYYVDSYLYTRLGMIGKERQRSLRGELPLVSLHKPVNGPKS